MNPSETLQKLSQAIQQIRSGLENASVLLPVLDTISAKAKEAEELEERIKDLEARGTAAKEALEKFEDALAKAIRKANEETVNPQFDLDTRLNLMDVFRKAFSELANVGIRVWIPKVGEPIDPEKHLVRGRAENGGYSDEVADVLTWGFRFPTGLHQHAEVLVGNLSRVEETSEKEEEPVGPGGIPQPKAGISMVLDEETDSDESEAATSQKKGKTAEEDLFEKLREAAQKNTQKRS
ncbi:MAG TPA: hypothetical protein VNK96_05195 [Fimbriimonadales bacterium]|nr:hypothetical protein [Fimbriimonadales bacterium]